MRFFDYIDTIEKPTIENIRVIYKAVNEKYDDLIDMALEPNSKNYKKWVQNMECLKKSENILIDCIGNNQITDTEWLELMYNIYRYQVKYGGLKYLTIELQKKGRMIDIRPNFFQFNCKRQVICWIENHFKKIDNYIEHQSFQSTV